MALPMPMPMPPPARSTPRLRTPLFLLGVGMALLAFILMFSFGILFANRTQTGAQVPVVVATEDIQAREAITPGMLTLASMPASALPPHAFVQLADLKGESALVTIYKGQAVTANVVASSPDQIAIGTSTYLPIPQGYVAFTIPTGELQGVGGYVAPGDYINVIATFNSLLFSPNAPRVITRTVYNELRIIRVGTPSAAPKEGQTIGVSTSLTVVLSECDAQYLQWLLTNVTLKYVLLSYKDYNVNSLSSPDQSCLPTEMPPVIGPAEVNARWGLTKQ
jgi:pilus assembly protein CpaB